MSESGEEQKAANLEELLRTYGRLYFALDGFWYVAVKNRFGNDAAVELDLWVWRKMVKYEMDRLSKALGIEGNDVAAAVGGLTASPWLQAAEHTVHFDGDGRAMLTVTSCPTLDALEREGDGREARHCPEVDGAIFQLYADYFNRNIRVRALLLPPASRQQDICCRWELSLQ